MLDEQRQSAKTQPSNRDDRQTPQAELAPPSSTTRLAGVTDVILAVVAFMLIIRLMGTLVGALVDPPPADDLRARSVLSLTASGLGEFVALGVLVVWLKFRGRSLTDLGLRRPATRSAWAFAILLTLFWIPSTLFGALRGTAPFLELSLFNLYGSAMAALAAGVVEEVLFRGYVMTRLADAGMGRGVQVLASMVLFGLAHTGWGLLSGDFNLGALLGAVIATSVLGLAYALIYLMGRRSLLPVIASHATTNFVIEPWLILGAISGTMS